MTRIRVVVSDTLTIVRSVGLRDRAGGRCSAFRKTVSRHRDVERSGDPSTSSPDATTRGPVVNAALLAADGSTIALDPERWRRDVDDTERVLLAGLAGPVL